jgi:hypothetical protein
MSGFLFDAQGPYIVSSPGGASPDDRDYSIDWTQVLALLGPTPPDTIASNVWNIPTGVTLDSSATLGNVTTCWLTTPTIGTYYISNTMTTVGGRTFTRGFRLIITENI